MTFSAFFSAGALLLALLQVPTAIATFDGVFKTANKKFVEIQVESGDTMRMYLTHGTKFVKDGKNAHASDFHDGDKVTVDAERDVRMNLLAVKIEIAKAEKPRPK
jgi:hypothetical protein